MPFLLDPLERKGHCFFLKKIGSGLLFQVAQFYMLLDLFLSGHFPLSMLLLKSVINITKIFLKGVGTCARAQISLVFNCMKCL